MNSTVCLYIFDCFCLFVVIVTVNLYTMRCKKVGVTIKFWNCPWVRYCIAHITHFAFSTPFPATGRSERKSGFNIEQYSAPQSSLCGLLWIIVSELVDYVWSVLSLRLANKLSIVFPESSSYDRRADIRSSLPSKFITHFNRSCKPIQ